MRSAIQFECETRKSAVQPKAQESYFIQLFLYLLFSCSIPSSTTKFSEMAAVYTTFIALTLAFATFVQKSNLLFAFGLTFNARHSICTNKQTRNQKRQE